MKVVLHPQLRKNNVNLFSYICNMITFGVISGLDGRVIEHEYCYVYPDKYVCIDANFFLVNGTAKNMEWSVKLTAYRLMALNPYCVTEDIAVYLCKRLNDIVSSGVQVRLTEALINSIVDTCDYEDFDTYRHDISVSKYVYWKRDLSGLLALTDEDVEYLSQFSDLEYNEKRIRLIAMKKQRYGLGAVNKTKRGKKLDMIYSAMIAVRESDEPITVRGIAKLTGLAESVVSGYIKEFSDMTDELSFVDGRSLIKDKILHDLESAVDEMKKAGMDVTKSELHRYTGISRPTINKYWGRLLNKTL